MMRKEYEDVANEWEADKRLIREVSEMCEEIADAELAEQGKQHAKEIYALEKEIAELNEEISRLHIDRIIALSI